MPEQQEMLAQRATLARKATKGLFILADLYVEVILAVGERVVTRQEVPVAPELPILGVVAAAAEQELLMLGKLPQAQMLVARVGREEIAVAVPEDRQTKMGVLQVLRELEEVEPVVFIIPMLAPVDLVAVAEVA